MPKEFQRASHCTVNSLHANRPTIRMQLVFALQLES